MKLTKAQILGLGILVVTTLLMVGVWITINEEVPVTISPKPVSKLPEEKNVEVRVGYGWSTKDNPTDAVQEAVSLMKKDLGEKSPEYILFFSGIGKGNEGYNQDEIMAEIKNQLGSNVQIHGGTSSLGVLTKEGFHVGRVGSLALMGVTSERMDFGVGGASLDELSPQEAGKNAIEVAIKNARREGLPKIVYMTASPGVEEEILLGIEEILGTDIPIIGGSAGDNDITGKWLEFTNDKIYKNGVVLTAVYTDLKVAQTFEHGYLRSEDKGLVTKADGRTIYEIDNRPAAEVYNEWTGGLIKETLENGGAVLAEATFYPLARVIRGVGGKAFYLSINVGSVNQVDKSLDLFANVEDGDEILLLHGNWELLLNRGQSTPHNAMISKNVEKGGVFFGIYTFCTGTILAIPDEERSKLPLLVDRELGGVPFIGAFTLGEQVFLPGVGNRHVNLVNSIIIFAPEE